MLWISSIDRIEIFFFNISSEFDDWTQWFLISFIEIQNVNWSNNWFRVHDLNDEKLVEWNWKWKYSSDIMEERKGKWKKISIPLKPGVPLCWIFEILMWQRRLIPNWRMYSYAAQATRWFTQRHNCELTQFMMCLMEEKKKTRKKTLNCIDVVSSLPINSEAKYVIVGWHQMFNLNFIRHLVLFDKSKCTLHIAQPSQKFITAGSFA